MDGAEHPPAIIPEYLSIARRSSFEARMNGAAELRDDAVSARTRLGVIGFYSR
jgi:hypothetical protein